MAKQLLAGAFLAGVTALIGLADEGGGDGSGGGDDYKPTSPITVADNDGGAGGGGGTNDYKPTSPITVADGGGGGGNGGGNDFQPTPISHV